MALNFNRPYVAGDNSLPFGYDSVQQVDPVALKLSVTVSAPTFACHLRYDNRVQRVLASDAAEAWDDAKHGRAASGEAWQSSARAGQPLNDGWTPAQPMDAETIGTAEYTRQQYNDRASRWQAGIPLGVVAGDTLAALYPTPLNTPAEWQGALTLPLAFGGEYVVLVPSPRTGAVAWDVTTGLTRSMSQRGGIGQPARIADALAWEWGIAPAPGREPEPPEPPEPPAHFVPDATIHFSVEWPGVHFAALHFGGLPTTRVPVRRVYIVSNNAQIVRLPGREPIPARSASMSIDFEAWAWSMSATLDHSALPLIVPDANGPVAIEITMNSGKWVALVESYKLGRTHGKTTLTVTGRSEAARLAAPYAPPRTYTPAATTARQLAEAELTRAGLITGFTLDWNIDDWLVPEGAWSCQNMTPIQVINRIAEAAGAYVNAHPSDRTLIVRPRYPLPPWQWASATMDKILPPDVLKTLNLQWQEKPLYNAVYVAGERAGIVGHVKRTGTAGDTVAQTIVDALITAQEPARGRGMAILSDTGRMAMNTLEMPLMDEIGLLPPGMFIEVDEGDGWRGIVRSTGVSADWGDALTIAQTVEVERHYS